MYPLYKFAKGETTMAQIKLTPEELRTSANRYTEGSENVTQVLTTLTNEQAIIADNWDGSAFDSFEAQFNELSPKIKEFAQLLQDINALLTSLSKLTKISLHKFTNFVITALGRQEPSYFCKDLK